MSLCTAFLQAATSLFSGELAKHYGRRIIQLVGNFSISILLLAVGGISYVNREDLKNDDIPQFSAIMSIVLILGFCVVFRLTTGTVAFVYISEILSVKGNAVATACHHSSAFITGVLFPIGEETLGIYSIFFIFGLFQIANYVYVYRNAKETKGLS